MGFFMGLDIKRAIKQHGLTSAEVANRIGVNKITFSYTINGNPTIESLNRIAEAIGCDVSELFEQPSTDVIHCPHCGGKIKITKE
jgi:transcriptional regulator with XRE-family HTH domain